MNPHMPVKITRLREGEEADGASVGFLSAVNPKMLGESGRV